MKISEVQQHITTLYKAGCRHTVLLLGPPGIGKSESAKNAATDLGIEVRQWQATIEDPLELPGLPAVRGEKAIRVPFEDKIPSTGKGFLIIDEINSASTLTQCSLYSLIWDRVLGGSKLGDDWMIIATGNRDSDRGVTQRIPTPLVSRMEHINVEPDHDSWLIMMALQGGNDVVRAFVKTRPDLFVTFKPDVPGPFACPRTWTMISKVMNAYDSVHCQIPHESLSGWIGEGPATELSVFSTMAKDLPDIEEIIKNPSKIKVPETPGALYAITTNLASRAKFENIGAIITFVRRIPTEFAVYCAMTAKAVEAGRANRMSPEEKKNTKRLQDSDDFKKWCIDHYDTIVPTDQKKK